MLDPVLKAGVGTSLTTKDLAASIRERLLPLVTVVTPNYHEAYALTASDDVETAGMQLTKSGTGAEFALITGADQDTEAVIHRLYHGGTAIRDYSCERLPGVFHGSGCTLSSAIAAQLGHGRDVPSAIKLAQAFTWESLASSGDNLDTQALPRRFSKP